MHQSGAPSTAVRLTEGGKTLTYSGDTEWTDALIPIADGADLLIIECYDYSRSMPGHTSYATLKEKRAALNAKRIMITHMNPTMLDRQDEARAAGLIVAEDGLVVEV
jgi:ribonuclease BN (tRNA processing enzyme)